MRRGIWELKLAMRMAAGRRRGGVMASASEAGGKLAFADERRARRANGGRARTGTRNAWTGGEDRRLGIGNEEVTERVRGD